jgi:hypothetical protein
MTEEIDWTNPQQVTSSIRKEMIKREENGKDIQKTNARNIFSLDKRQCMIACKMGLGVGISYLVLGCFTQGSTGITKASANALETHVGINHNHAKKHIASLRSVGLVERIDRSAHPHSKPVYRIIMPAAPELIWFPNQIVQSDERPLKLLWQMQCAKMLDCFIELYSSNHLLTDGGVNRSVLRVPFERVEVARAGEYTVWGFRQPARMPLGDAAEFFEEFCDLGLLEQSPHLFLSDDAEASLLHPYGMGGQRGSPEDMIGMAAHKAGLALISEDQRRRAEAEKLWLAPVPRRIPRVAMIAIARLRHQPETQQTVDWRRELLKNAPGFVDGYDRLATAMRNKLALAS